MIIMLKFEILEELLKCDRQMKGPNNVGKKMALTDLFDAVLLQTFNL